MPFLTKAVIKLISSASICAVIFSIFISTTFINTNSLICAYSSNGNRSLTRPLPPIKHKINATLKKGLRHIKMRGASDFIVVKHLPDGTLGSTPIFVHFGTRIFAEKDQKAAAEGLRVKMALNGRTIKAIELRTDQNGIVEEKKVNLIPLVDLLSNNGRYSVRFSVEDWKGRTVSVDCSLYYWDSATKLVVSDIDGTVTKSDVWGMILGKMWIQRNIRTLYGKIKQKGYKIIYLSARPASVGTLTRKFLKRLQMPSGPLLLSSEPLAKALKTAVKDPQRIKVICMQRLKALYNSRRSDGTKRRRSERKVINPFFAAFGNQRSDRLAYEMLSVPTVFMVNPRGAVTVNGKGAASVDKAMSYRYIIQHMESFFPRWRPISDLHGDF